MKATDKRLEKHLIDSCEDPCDFCEMHKKIGINFQHRPIVFCKHFNETFTETSELEAYKESIREQKVAQASKKTKKKATLDIEVKTINLLNQKITE